MNISNFRKYSNFWVLSFEISLVSFPRQKISIIVCYFLQFFNVHKFNVGPHQSFFSNYCRRKSFMKWTIIIHNRQYLWRIMLNTTNFFKYLSRWSTIPLPCYLRTCVGGVSAGACARTHEFWKNIKSKFKRVAVAFRKQIITTAFQHHYAIKQWASNTLWLRLRCAESEGGGARQAVVEIQLLTHLPATLHAATTSMIRRCSCHQ